MADISSTHEKTRAEVADYLREFADRLDSRGASAGTEARSGGTDSMGATTSRTETDAGVSGDAGRHTETDDAGRHTETGASGTTDPTSRSAETTGDADVERTGAARSGDKVTIIAGNESATINPPDLVQFDVDVTTDSSMLDAGRSHSATFTISWDADAVEEDDELRVE